MVEIEGPPKKYGFRIDLITPEFMASVVKIYQDTVGKTHGSQTFLEQLTFGVEDIQKDLTSNHFCERRLGSKLDYNSKLIIRMSYQGDNLCFVKFNPNLDSDETDITKKDMANKMSDEFESKINEFLINSGLGTEL